jgi:phenylacetate-CoA ligase
MTTHRKGVKKIKDILLLTQYMNAFDLSSKNIIPNLKKAKRDKVTFLGGYASSLNVIAETAISEGVDLGLKGVISWGDKLFDSYKRNIRDAFEPLSIIETYGCTEGIVIAGTCSEGNFHVMSPHVYLELLDKDGNEVKAGEIGYVVVTRLDAFHFPLIRYYLGDLAVKEDDDKKCKCGRQFPLLKKVIGRDTDIVHTPTGKALIVHFFTGILEHVAEIYQFRVIQKTMEEIEIEYIQASDSIPPDLKKISETMYSKAGEVFPVTYKKVSAIPSTPSGKPQIVLNLIASGITK